MRRVWRGWPAVALPLCVCRGVFLALPSPLCCFFLVFACGYLVGLWGGRPLSSFFFLLSSLFPRPAAVNVGASVSVFLPGSRLLHRSAGHVESRPLPGVPRLPAVGGLGGGGTRLGTARRKTARPGVRQMGLVPGVSPQAVAKAQGGVVGVASTCALRGTCRGDAPLPVAPLKRVGRPAGKPLQLYTELEQHTDKKKKKPREEGKGGTNERNNKGAAPARGQQQHTAATARAHHCRGGPPAGRRLSPHASWAAPCPTGASSPAWPAAAFVSPTGMRSLGRRQTRGTWATEKEEEH